MRSKAEHGEQVAFVNWFRATYPAILIFAIPNGEKRDIGTAVKLKAEGVVPGIPDLYIPAWRLWVEMKAKGGKISHEQSEVMDYLQTVGDTCIVAYGWQDAVEQVQKVLACRLAGR